MFRKICDWLLVNVTFGGIIYILTVFINLEPNPIHWSQGTRAYTAMIIGVIMFASMVVIQERK